MLLSESKMTTVFLEDSALSTADFSLPRVCFSCTAFL